MVCFAVHRSPTCAHEEHYAYSGKEGGDADCVCLFFGELVREREAELQAVGKDSELGGWRWTRAFAGSATVWLKGVDIIGRMYKLPQHGC